MDNNEETMEAEAVEATEVEVIAEEETVTLKKTSKKQSKNVDVETASAEIKEATIEDKPKKVHKGSFWCFVMIGFIAIALILDAICGFLVRPSSIEGAVLVFKNIAYILITIAQLVAYSFVAIQSYYWVSHRKTGWKVTFWIMVAIIAISLIVGLVTTFVDMTPKDTQNA